MENESDISGKKESSSVVSFLIYIVFAFVTVGAFRMFIAQPYIVNGSSMNPTFKDSDYLIVDQISKRFELPARGSVIIVLNPKYPQESTKYFIKRLIAYPFEKVSILNGEVSIISEKYPDGLLLDEPYIKYQKNESYSIELKEDQYFVMGDNRAGSSDSRIWGPVHKDAIVGSPVLRLLPIGGISLFPGKAILEP